MSGCWLCFAFPEQLRRNATSHLGIGTGGDALAPALVPDATEVAYPSRVVTPS